MACDLCSDFKTIPNEYRDNNIDSCIECCCETIKNKIEIKEISEAWFFLFTELKKTFIKEADGEDTRFFRISIYIALSSLFLSSFRAIMLLFLERKGINTKLLVTGKWLQQNLILKSKLCQDILLTQGKNLELIAINKTYMEAIDFFTKEDGNPIHRNKAAHDFCDALASLGSTTNENIQKHFFYICHLLASITKTI